ncbi:MAG: UDP-2,3-diacylglucosamine diphosphatase [Methylococcaceae bacterium]|jgi:UDP-2,3-diacylglucosamine hydrolase
MLSDTLFLSDLHISIDKPDITQRLVNFLENPASQAARVYILGDLFDAWVGDDDDTKPNKAIKKQLKKLTDSGTQVYFQPGNRDFLLGLKFCADTGVQLLGDYEVIDLYGTPTLLTHGDLLCTDDLAYQAFRIKSHDLAWQQNVLSKPLWLRLLAARWYRFRSFLHKRKQMQAIMDVNHDTVVQALLTHACLRLIHGHTHRPGLHEFKVNGLPAQRFVLAAWEKQRGEYLRWTQEGYCLHSI